MTQEEKNKRYDEALERAKKLQKTCDSTAVVGWCEYIFPELKESEDEKMRKSIIYALRNGGFYSKDKTDEAIAWLEKKGEHLENYDEAEKEKADFVGDGFIECHADFLDFKEGSTYWLEYIGDDKYNVRSDNLLGKTYHITPCQLYTVFKKLTWLEKQGEQKPSDKTEQKFHPGDWITHNTANFVFKIINVGSNGYEVVNRENYKKTISYDNEGNYHLWTIADAKDGDVLDANGAPFI